MSEPTTTTPGNAAPQSGVSAIALVYWTVASVVLTGGVISGLLLAANRPDWWQSFGAATVIGAASSMAAVLPILVVLRGAPDMIAKGYLAGMGLRMMCFLGLLLVATHTLGLPTKPTAIFALSYVLAGLIAEVLVLVRGLRSTYPRRGPLKPPVKLAA